MHKLEQQLKEVEKELQLKGEEQMRLERVRDQVEQEIDELTANLFEVCKLCNLPTIVAFRQVPMFANNKNNY